MYLYGDQTPVVSGPALASTIASTNPTTYDCGGKDPFESPLFSNEFA